ncbi:hypothetical protein QN362_13490 [Actimicrobium sp. CCC2.4]|uniref:hypothetical protein n=1 Tax=Actimicrobium sp. CCC2.4 TaxID=3048606 RepID=UPI002AC9679A|nr:hypothetical protein [Actimicrobium sp. CCC2.4]MEB0136350.1 hypothetical protein [Actimicrobium sp. CCC2.4]WPX31170.1 hypothetical protein RHM62_13045 [Actimicrobium sp. CCC2.4]
MSKISHFFDSIGKAICSISKDLFGMLKGVMDTLTSLAKAVATGDMKEIAKNLAQLATQLANLPADLATTAVMDAVKEGMKLAGDVLGCADKPWMHKVMETIQTAESLTALASPVGMLADEAAAMVTGKPSPAEDLFKQVKNTVS